MNSTVSKADMTLIVKDISMSLKVKDIKEIFGRFGKLRRVTVINCNYACIRMDTRQSALRAFHFLNGMVFNGRQLRISFAASENLDNPNVFALLKQNAVQVYSLHLRFYAKLIGNGANLELSEASFFETFFNYGSLQDISLRSIKTNKIKGAELLK
jgi:RNA recognition motif-containing protein